MSTKDKEGGAPVPHSYNLGTVEHTKLTLPCRHYLDLSFDKPQTVNYIGFRNYYCASISIVYKRKGPLEETPSKWTPLLSNYELMLDPHFEDDAQKDHVLCLAQLCENMNTTSVQYLRFYFLQPSPRWRSVPFQLHQILLFSKGDVASIRQQLLSGNSGPHAPAPPCERRTPRRGTPHRQVLHSLPSSERSPSRSPSSAALHEELDGGSEEGLTELETSVVNSSQKLRGALKAYRKSQQLASSSMGSTGGSLVGGGGRSDSASAYGPVPDEETLFVVGA
ncbi:hypothetical protein CYMTET_24312 [Cymbomonas tetramitiformis]|uniref:Uncharacterized protein n=1 Tax=Cymbomonas tetramitiformis TaxID=36881 RepID=A0AAE0L063_9CHLO|nr:hypothetical protein CYMTET_24312 [Cymbomonas tetramitiformis]